jgi:peptide deformylase
MLIGASGRTASQKSRKYQRFSLSTRKVSGPVAGCWRAFSMAQLPILRYPDPRLHTVARPVERFDEDLRRLVADMFETMYAAHGIGLAATQVDRHVRVVVIDVSEERNQPLVLVNPDIVWMSPERVRSDEGCLSVPGIYDGVERAQAVRVEAHDAEGQRRTIEAEGLLAVCIQHELDHLLGKVFVEYLSPLKRNRIKAKLLKQQREEERERREPVRA